MKRILLLCPHPMDVAPGQRLKYEQYLDDWVAAGYQVEVSPFMTDRFQKIVYSPGRFLEKVFWTLFGYVRRLRDLVRLPFYDGAYVFLWVTPLGPPLSEWLTGRLARRLVFDIDDLVFLGHSSEANRVLQFLKGRRKPLQLMKEADHVVVCTPYLNEFVQRINPRTTDISSTIDTETYQPANRYDRAGPITLGWSGSHSTARYLHLLDDVLRELAGEIDLRLKVIGDPAFTLDGVEVDAQAWRLESEVDDLREIDIGLYPLPHQEWVLGKSGLKALQYMALGIPTVAEDYGAAGRIIADGENGFLVEGKAAWKDAVLRLARDPDLRRRLGSAGRRTVVERFSVAANRAAYRRVLREGIGPP